MRDVFGWKPIPLRKGNPRWDEVRHNQVAAPNTLKTINDVDVFVNRLITYTPDAIDKWALPSETLANRKGDCEDFALLKRALLIAAGWQDENILFLIVNDLIAGRDHALLVVDNLVLDNFNSLSLPTEEVEDYSPIVGFSADRGWTYGKAV